MPYTTLFVPCATRGEAAGRVTPALKPLADGRLALLVFTSLDALVTGCGPDQPWVGLPEATVEQVFRRSHADVVVVDVDLTADHRWGASGEPVTIADHRAAHPRAGE